MADAAKQSERIPGWYSLAWCLAIPFVALYLLWRGLRQGQYLSHWSERFLGAGDAARPGAQDEGPRIWLHAVSVGETRAARPLIEALMRARPQARFILTHMTPTGRAAGAELVHEYAGRIVQRYLPYDLPWAVRRFLHEERPAVGVIMETEVWPNMLQAAHDADIPVVLANARLSERSLAKGLRYERVIRAAARSIVAVGAQTLDDGERISRLYSGAVRVTGNVKFDAQPDPSQVEAGRRMRGELLDRLGPGEKGRIWLFASTREGEERLLLDALARANLPRPAPLLAFVPRHPQRFDEVARLLAQASPRIVRRSQWSEVAQAPEDAGAWPLLLGDSMGEMPFYYGLADVAFIGGSLLPLGGQNLIEACACGCPVVTGPHMFNFSQAAADAVAAGAALRAHDADDALRRMAEVCASSDSRQRMSQAAMRFAQAHAGASARTVELIEAVLAAPVGRRN
jgi:3-deoxy-D-manno-octulosonic-acid transferase